MNTGTGIAGRPDGVSGASFGRAVRARRLEVGMTQVRLAELAGMSQAALSRLERGRGVPTFLLLERIARAMDSDLLISVSSTRGLRVVFRAAATPFRRGSVRYTDFADR